MKYKIGTRVRLIQKYDNIRYFEKNFKGYDPNGVYTVTGHMTHAPDCIYIDCKPEEGIYNDRFEVVVIKENHLPEDLFTI